MLGQRAYEGYLKASNGRSLVSGQALPAWDQLPAEIRTSWDAAAQAIVDTIRLIGCGARKLMLTLDEADFATINTEIAHRQLSRHADGSGTIVPEGSSCLTGALLAEVVRDLDEYRGMYSRGTDLA